MYAYLRGTLAVKGRDFVALDCGGVGYKIFVTEGYLQACKIGEEATLYTHLVVREEELSLYGFSSEAEKEMFEKLIGVSGVGPKAGRAILSEMPAREVAAAIFSADAREGKTPAVPGTGRPDRTGGSVCQSAPESAR